MTHQERTARESLVRRGTRLTWATLGYNSLEAMLSIGAGIAAGSIALIGFGVDSVIELSSSIAALWRLSSDAAPEVRERVERQTLRFIGACFLLLAIYVLVDALRTLVTRAEPEKSPIGIAIAIGSLIVMPLLARAKRRVAVALESGALRAEARQTELCTWLSAILLAGLLLNATVGWWWADPVAALVMVPLIGWEGIEAITDDTVAMRTYDE